MKRIFVFPAALLISSAFVLLHAADQLKVHGIFRSNMVLQRDKPITVWGWAPAGSDVKVSLGDHAVVGKAGGDEGRWMVRGTR
jgi:sialate O-acetylesterase